MTKNEFIESMAGAISKYAPAYDIRVVSPIIAQACLESAYGTSELAKINNFFGIKYHAQVSSMPAYAKVGSEQNADGSYTSSTMLWCQFESFDKGVEGYFKFLFGRTGITRYDNLKGIEDPKTYCETIRADGYATSLKYVENLMNVITSNNLTQYDTLLKNEDDKVGGVTINKSIKCNTANYGGNRSTSQIKYIVIHYTANKTDTAKANATYFKNNVVKASAHYFVDETSIYQSVADSRVAWAVGGSRWSNYKQTGGASMYKKITNTNSISIELCSRNGVIQPATLANAKNLIVDLCLKYNINPEGGLYRHFDVTGKPCPGWTLNDTWAWLGYVAEVKKQFEGAIEYIMWLVEQNNKK